MAHEQPVQTELIVRVQPEPVISYVLHVDWLAQLFDDNAPLKVRCWLP